MTHPVVKALDDARELIEQGGHCKGAPRQIRQGRTSYCVIGAISEATKGNGIGTFAEAKDAAYKLLPAGYASLVGWNDAPSTTAEQVCALLSRAADRVEQEVAP